MAGDGSTHQTHYNLSTNKAGYILMAKKKSVRTSKAKRITKKKKVRKSPAAAKASKKKVPRKAAASKAKAARKPAAKTVDMILKAFEKERVTKNRSLTSTRKKIEALTKQIASIKTELEGLKKTAVETEIAIDTLDTRRDAEVGALLSGMGIDLVRAAASSKPKEPTEKSTPLFDTPVQVDVQDENSPADSLN